MRKTTVLFLSVMMVVGIATSTQAGKVKKNEQPALATIQAGECVYGELVDPYGEPLLVNWSWSGGTFQTKFGGDAVYLVSSYSYYDIDGNLVLVPVSPLDGLLVEVELEQLGTDPDDLVDPYNLVYSCTVIQGAVGDCSGSILNVQGALNEAIAFDIFEETGVEVEVTVETYELSYVKVKAMNPGTGSKRQNYPLVDVCGNLVD